MEENKKNYALWLYPETVRRMDSSLELANCQSRSEFVEKALHFYMGYLASEDITEYRQAGIECIQLGRVPDRKESVFSSTVRRAIYHDIR